MKVAFLNPPWWVEETGKPLRRGIRAGSRWPHTVEAHFKPGEWKVGSYAPFPFFLGYAASYLNKHVSEAEVFVRDSIARGESYEAFLEWLSDYHPAFVVIESATPSWDHDREVIAGIQSLVTHAKIIVAGPIAQTDPAKLREAGAWAIIRGEYEKGIVRAICGESGLIEHDLLTEQEMNDAPFPMFDEEVAHRYWDANPKGNRETLLQVWGSRGCPFKCMAGDTPVNTVLGSIPIKDLVGVETGVFTYDRKTKRVKVCNGTNVRQYGTSKLMRVRFDDGTHIDCTPDHRFLAFKWGNQFVGEREWECEAKDLRNGQHVRALNIFTDAYGYQQAAWRRKDREALHRLVLSWKIGRPLTGKEQTHHKDRNKSNNHPDNLELCADHQDHWDRHPEIAERMSTNNPAKKGLNPLWIERMKRGLTGIKRSSESKERYRLAAIKREASRSPEFKKRQSETMRSGWTGNRTVGRARGQDGRFEPADLQNHRVVSVEELAGDHPVFCLTVPETGWFYANNVLVKNCCFCVFPAVMTGDDPDGLHKRTVRFYGERNIEDFITTRIRMGQATGHQIRTIYFDDDTGNLGDRHTLEVCSVMRRIGLPWSMMCRADTIKLDTWREMRDSGCFGVKIGFESGVQRVVDEIINKRLDVENAALTCRFIRTLGMTVHGTFTVGLPGETEEERQKTVDFIRELYETGALDTHQVSHTAEIEGTPLANLKQLETLKAYPGAIKDAGYRPVTDGAR